MWNNWNLFSIPLFKHKNAYVTSNISPLLLFESCDWVWYNFFPTTAEEILFTCIHNVKKYHGNKNNIKKNIQKNHQAQNLLVREILSS